MPTGGATLVERADAAMAAGKVNEARSLLTEAVDSAGSDPALWLRLAAACRAAGEPSAALNATTRALEIAPLDFTALLMRASLLDRLGASDAPEAWSQALAQRPAGELPPHVLRAISQGEARVSQWVADREQRMRIKMEAAEAQATPEQRKRIDRFRTNVLRRTRPYHSEPTHFHYPELTEREFHPRSHFTWMDALERATDEIQAELSAIMRAECAELVPYIEYPDHMPLDQWRELNRSRQWTAIHLLRNGETVEANARLCPKTLAILRECRQPQVPGASPNAMFSLLAPQTHIPPHVGVNNTRLVCHLPLIVPEGCWFRVGAETRPWKRGQAFVFDDTIEHEAMNPTDQLRIILIFDVWHPELSEKERDAVAALVASENQQASAAL
jgi:aspartyl/asparaginyl beta-hydroxylase (cupin superfamily)